MEMLADAGDDQDNQEDDRAIESAINVMKGVVQHMTVLIRNQGHVRSIKQHGTELMTVLIEQGGLDKLANVVNHFHSTEVVVKGACELITRYCPPSLSLSPSLPLPLLPLSLSVGLEHSHVLPTTTHNVQPGRGVAHGRRRHPGGD